MSVVETLRSVLPVLDDGPDVSVLVCEECGNRFESSKSPEEAHCMSCISDDIRAAE